MGSQPRVGPACRSIAPPPAGLGLRPRGTGSTEYEEIRAGNECAEEQEESRGLHGVLRQLQE